MSFKGRHSSGMRSSRKPWSGLDKAKKGKHSAALVEADFNLAGGGTSKRVSAAAARKPIAVVLAVFAAIALALSLGLSSYAYANPLDDFTNAVTSFFTGSSRAATIDDDSAYAADGDTRGTYTNVLGDNSSTRYDGRVWTDKTVSTEDVSFDGIDETIQNDSDFLVTYSALATSTQVSGESTVPTDVVFIVDLSGSMSNGDSGMDDGRSRIAHVVDALNEAIETLMASNPQSRVAVVGYSSTATTLLPLDHYTKQSNRWGEEYDFFSLNRDTPSNSYADLTVHAVNSRGQNVNEEEEVSGGTNVQMGVYQGMNILASESSTTATVGGQEVNRVPSVVLMSDGAATYSSSSTSWWAPNNNDDDGPGNDSFYGNGMKAMMTAAYMKQAIDRNYNPPSDQYAVNVYTIGIGTADLDDDDDRNLANITLNPAEHWNDNNSMANAIRNAWSGTSTGSIWQDRFGGGSSQSYSDSGYITNNNTGTPRIAVDSETHRVNRRDVVTDDVYELTHPTTGYDINEVGLQYNDAYYDALTSDDIENIFQDIVSSISVSTPSVPTEVTGDDPTADGYITYSDTTGQYMEIKDVKTLIWSDQVYTQKNSSSNGNVTTYTFEGDSIDSPVYGEHSVSEISITVTDNDDHTQTIEVKIPASAIPLRVNTIALDAQGGVDTNTANNAMPLRLVYSVGFESDIDPTTLAGIDGADGVSKDYIEANTDGDKVNFYSNSYSAGTDDQDEEIGAHVTFTPASSNPFYFFQEDTPIFTDQDGRNQATSFSENETYYIPVTYYSGTSEQTIYIPRSGADMADYIKSEHVDGEGWWDPGDDLYYIEAGSPRLGNLQDVTASKATAPGANNTDTAANYREPVYGTDGAITVLLGNNGRLQLDAPASLTITKNVTADEGLTAPAGTFKFQITSTDKTGQQVKAVKTTPSTTGGQSSTEEITVQFNDQGIATVELTAGQSVELKNMAGADYSIEETELPDGFAITNVEGADQVSDNHVASGTVDNNSDGDSVTFTNNYSVSSITTEDLEIDLGGTKTIDGRDFQQGDSFTFKIAAAGATPNAPLPENTTVTISPTSGTSAAFSFDDITFTAPGEYRYIITEVNPNDDGDDETTGLGGVDYDSSIYRVNIVIVDNGNGTMRLATTEEIADMSTQGDLKYTSNPMVQIYNGSAMVGADDNAVAFENNYSADSTTATIQGTKVLNVTNSDYTLEDGDFTFTIEALGSTTDSRDTYTENDFTTDSTQPMPVNERGSQVTQAANIANGNVDFAFANGAFTQDMVGKTFGYKITEANASAPTNTVMDANTSRIIWITVADDGDGNVTATVLPNDAQQGNRANNFTFTNSYEPASVTTDTNAKNLINVKKTFTGFAWNDGFGFKLEAVSNTAGIDKADMPMPKEGQIQIGTGVNESGVRTGNFDSMTFTKEGTYTYQVTEVLPDGVTVDNKTADGITYDTHTAKVTITVTEDKSAGTLSASVSYDNSTAITDDDKACTDVAAYTNTYASSFDGKTAVTLTGTKKMDVADGFTYTLRDGGFYFDVTPVGDAPQVQTPVGNTGSAQVQDSNDWTSTMTLLNNLTFSMSDMVGATVNDDGTRSKDFSYIVTEQTPQSGAAGVSYDETAYQVIITVTDDGKGTLSAGTPDIQKGSWDGTTFTPAAEADVEQVEFTNSYAPESITTAPLAITKTLNGQTPAADAYSFTMALVSADPQDGITLPDTTTMSNNASGKVQFGDITFSKPGTYVVKVTENIPDSATNPNVNDGATTYANASDDEKAQTGWTLNGVTYDNHTTQSTFTVTDNGGKLTAIRSNTTGSQTFANTYKATGDLNGATNLNVTKTLNGRTFQQGDSFTFTLTPGDEPTQTAVENGTVVLPDNANGITIAYAEGDNTNSKQAAFGDIAFTAAGNYVFNITEVVPDDATNAAATDEEGNLIAYKDASDEQKAQTGWTLNGVTYDNQPHQVTVSATDENNDGTLTITVTGGANPTITNTYKPGGDVTLVKDSFKLTKVLQGKDWDGDTFTFQLTGKSATTPDGDPIESIPMPTEDIDGDGNAALATVSAKNGETEDGDDCATFSFGSITYDTIGTYVYEVREVVPQPGDVNYNAGITYSNTVAIITVEVTDNLNGGLNVAVKSQENTTFTNEYGTELEYGAAGGLAIVKNLTGANLTDSNPFTFTVTPVDSTDGTTAEETAQKLGIKTGETFATHGDFGMDNNGVSHESISVLGEQAESHFTQNDVGKTYTFTVSETNDGKAGYTYDGRTFTVTITTFDDGQGGIKVFTNVAADDGSYNETFTYDNDESTDDQEAIVPFNNTYNATGELGGNGSVSLVANKALNNADIADYAGDFTFNVTASNGTDTKTYATAQNAADGSIAFPAIQYSTAGLIADAENRYCGVAVQDDGTITYTYTYQVAETTSGLPAGITANAASFTVSVVVTDDGSGTLGIQVNYPTGSENGLTFTNTYGADATVSVVVGGTKSYNVASGATKAPDITGAYTFTLTGVDEAGNAAPLPNDAQDSVTANNQTTGAVDFGTITYDIADMEGATDNPDGTRTKIFTYTVTESGDVAGVVNDANTTRTFTVTLTDDGQGGLTAVSSETPGAQFNFTNSYNLTPESSSPTGNGGLTIKKTLEGRDLAEGEFTFQMTGAAGTAAEGMDLTATNTAAGTVSFGTLTFEKPGTYQFQISEVHGSLGGVSYDTAVYNAKATVIDDGDGTLSVEWSFTNAADEPITSIEFANSYQAASTSVVLGASKALDGRALTEGEFSFELKDADGKVLQTKQNDENGAIAFDTLSYYVKGTYTYTISEVVGDDSTITYDETVYNVAVKVSDPGTGALQAETTITNAETGEVSQANFINTYTAPPAGGGDEGNGGDEGPIEHLAKTSDTWLPYLCIGNNRCCSSCGYQCCSLQDSHTTRTT